MDEYMAYIWIGVAVVMTIAEIGTAQLVSVWFVIGALCAAVTVAVARVSSAGTAEKLPQPHCPQNFT